MFGGVRRRRGGRADRASRRERKARRVRAPSWRAQVRAERLQAARVSGTITGTVMDEAGGGACAARWSRRSGSPSPAPSPTSAASSRSISCRPASTCSARTCSASPRPRADDPRRRQRLLSSGCSCAGSTARCPPWHHRHGHAAGQGAADHRGRVRSAARRRRRTECHRRGDIRTTKPRGGCAISSAASSRIPSQIVVLTDDEAFVPSNGSLFGRAMGSAASVASSFFTDFPFSGEVNFLTTGARRAGRDALHDGVAARRGLSRARRARRGRRLVDPRGDERGRSVVVERRRRVHLQAWRRAQVRHRPLLQHAGLPRWQPRGAGGGHRWQPQRRRALRLRRMDDQPRG